MAVNVKAYYGQAGRGYIRRFVITSPASYGQLAEKIGADVDKPYRLFWIDSDGDLVSLGSEEDLNVAAATVDKGQVLRVVVQEEATTHAHKCGARKAQTTPESECPRRRSRNRLQHPLPLLFPTDLLGSLFGVPSSDPFDHLLGHDSCLSDFMKLWNAVAWVSKERQGKHRSRRAEQGESLSAAKRGTESEEHDELISEGESNPDDIRPAGSETGTVAADPIGTGSAVDKEEGEEPLVVDIRQHIQAVDEVDKDDDCADSKSAVDEKEEERPIGGILQYIQDVDGEQRNDKVEGKQLWQSSLTRMEEMGFKDESGWLSRLIQAKNGDVEETLETLRTVQGALQGSAK